MPDNEGPLFDPLGDDAADDLFGPQGEDHEAGIVAVAERFQYLHRREVEAIIAAYLSSRCPSPERALLDAACEGRNVAHRRMAAMERNTEKLVEALREIATRPTVERNPDGVDQAAATMQLIAREALAEFSDAR